MSCNTAVIKYMLLITHQHCTQFITNHKQISWHLCCCDLNIPLINFIDKSNCSLNSAFADSCRRQEPLVHTRELLTANNQFTFWGGRREQEGKMGYLRHFSILFVYSPFIGVAFKSKTFN